MTHPGGRPRSKVDEESVVRGYKNGTPMAQLAALHDVDRCVIRWVLDKHDVPRQEHRGAHWAQKRAQGGAS